MPLRSRSVFVFCFHLVLIVVYILFVYCLTGTRVAMLEAARCFLA